MTDHIEIHDEYGNVSRSVSLTPNRNDPRCWTLDQPIPLTDNECDRALVHIDGRTPERLGRRADGDPNAAIHSLHFVPPTSVEAYDAARVGEPVRATLRPVSNS
jgi:hypothetical protein